MWNGKMWKNVFVKKKNEFIEIIFLKEKLSIKATTTVSLNGRFFVVQGSLSQSTLCEQAAVNNDEKPPIGLIRWLLWNGQHSSSTWDMWRCSEERDDSRREYFVRIYLLEMFISGVFY